MKDTAYRPEARCTCNSNVLGSTAVTEQTQPILTQSFRLSASGNRKRAHPYDRRSRLSVPSSIPSTLFEISLFAKRRIDFASDPNQSATSSYPFCGTTFKLLFVSRALRQVNHTYRHKHALQRNV